MFAELVCSNSLRNDSMETAVGVLKEEMRRLRWLIIATADRVRVPAGSALAVDPDGIRPHDQRRDPRCPSADRDRAGGGDGTAIGTTIVATGPLTSAAFGEELNRIVGSRNLYFLRRNRADCNGRIGRYGHRLHGFALG